SCYLQLPQKVGQVLAFGSANKQGTGIEYGQT
ncbi:MAG: hypothetical protein ACJAX5_002499, partial [Patiriisocius sp.]